MYPCSGAKMAAMNVAISEVTSIYNLLGGKCLKVLREMHYQRTGEEMPEAASQVLGLDREMSRRWWVQMEAGETMVPFGTVVALAQLVRVDLEVLLAEAFHLMAHGHSKRLMELAARPAPLPPERPVGTGRGRPRGPSRHEKSFPVGPRVGRMIDEIRQIEQQQPSAGVAEHHPVEKDKRPQEGGRTS